MDTEHLRIFTAVARTCSFAEVAKERSVAPSSISRAIRALEAELGLRLFERTTRAVSLNEAGQRYLDHAIVALEALDAAAETARQSKAIVSGHLRITASVSYGNAVLARQMGSFQQRYPDVTSELLLSDEVVDLVRAGVDVAIRHGVLADSSLVATKLHNVEYQLVAAPSYLLDAPALTSPNDLSNHATVNLSLPAFQKGWCFQRDTELIHVTPEPSLISSNAEAVRRCADSGMGVALLPDWIVREDIISGRLVRLLPEWSAHAVGMEAQSSIWLLRPSRAFTPAKVSAFYRHLQQL